MHIIVHRNTGISGSARYMKIKVNGKEEKLKLDEPNKIILDEETALLELKQVGTKRVQLEVSDGDVLEISNKQWLTLSLFIVPIFSILIFSWPFELYVLGFALMAFYIYNYLFGFYKVAILE